MKATIQLVTDSFLTLKINRFITPDPLLNVQLLIDCVPISSKIFPCTVSNTFPMPITLLLMMQNLLTETNNTFSLYFIWHTELSLFVLQIIDRGFTSSLCIFYDETTLTFTSSINIPVL